MSYYEIIELPRGGTVLRTSCGLLQVGATPETIKDSLKLLNDVPSYYILPNNLFSAEYKISLADLEFPAYYNYFVKRRPIRIIGSPQQISVVMQVLKEAIFGPECIQIEKEFPFNTPKDHIPDLKKEMEFLKAKDLSGRRKMELQDIVVPMFWGPSNRVPFGDIALEKCSYNTLRLVDGKKIILEFSMDFKINKEWKFESNSSQFEPPNFGITVIGTGSGFDPNEMTSGFIIWVNKRGILVDPPVYTTEWLKSANINPMFVTNCILTHCHADHDAGILQKALEESKINLYTTETILRSFIKKYQSLTGLSYKSFIKLFNFNPVMVGVPIPINDAEVRFFYTLHSVPTIGFEIYYQGKSFVYSSDSLYDPEVFKNLLDAGVINQHRYSQLLNFPWHHTVIFHEAGIPPLHTPISVLQKLPEDIQEKTFLIHVSNKILDSKMKLKKAPTGIENTIVIPVVVQPKNEIIEYLDVLEKIDLFSDLPIRKAKEFVSLVRVEKIDAGKKFIKEGDVGDKFYIILHGKASVYKNGKFIKSYTSNDYIGETSIILNLPRNADVIADTELRVLVMDKYDFLYFIRDTEVMRKMKLIAENRENNSNELFDESVCFKYLTPIQRTSLQGIMIKKEIKAGYVIIEEKKDTKYFYLIDSGIVRIKRLNKEYGRIGRGSFLGKVTEKLHQMYKSRFSLIAETDCKVYYLDISEFYKFIEKNPGVFLLLYKTSFKKLLNWVK